MRMRYLITAQDIGELGLIKSLCEANGIVCMFQNEHVSSLYPGVLGLCCQVMVDESEWDRATALISRLRLQIREVAPST